MMFPSGCLSRQSLVTPIDWKLNQVAIQESSPELHPSRQSLVTPIDWKLPVEAAGQRSAGSGRQSLVTPIDWKHELPLIAFDQLG